MCQECFSDYEKVPLTQQIRSAAKLVNHVYNSWDGGSGGYGHIVFDDWNLDDHSVNYCLQNANEKTASDYICEETRTASILALEAFLNLSEDERAMALGIAKGYVNGVIQ